MSEVIINYELPVYRLIDNGNHLPTTSAVVRHCSEQMSKVTVIEWYGSVASSRQNEWYGRNAEEEYQTQLPWLIKATIGTP